MSETKIQIKVGIVEFSGEGNQDWLATQLDKILEKVPELLKIELGNPVAGGQENGSSKANPTSNNIPTNLATFFKEKNATVSQVKKFIATAAFLQLNGKRRLMSSDVTSAIKNANQTRLNNAADCLGQNIKKGHCEKDGKEFFVTVNGLSDLGIN